METFGSIYPKFEAANADLTAQATQAFIAKVAMAMGYGDSWTNMIQPFWTLAFFLVVAAGCRLQARDIMGYTFVAMLWSFIIFTLGVAFLPVSSWKLIRAGEKNRPPFPFHPICHAH